MITTTEFYRDFYGCTASVKHNDNRAILTVRTSSGGLVKKQEYRTRHGAMIALGRLSDCWKYAGMQIEGKLKL